MNRPHVVYPYDVGYLHVVDHTLDAAWRACAAAYRPLPFPEDRFGDPDINLELREGWAYQPR